MSQRLKRMVGALSGALVCLVIGACSDVKLVVSQAEAGTDQFHTQFNSARFGDIHRAADSELQRTVTEQQLGGSLTMNRRVLGQFHCATAPFFSLRRARGGMLVTLAYVSLFTNGSAEEQFVWRVRGGVATLQRYTVNHVKIVTHVRVETAKPATRAVRLVPILASQAHLEFLQRYYQERLAIEIEIVPELAPDRAAWTEARHQWSAEGLAEQVRQSRANDEAVLIGVTGEDLYLRNGNRRFVFGWRPDDRVAVVSYARMDPRFLGQREDINVLRTRLRRMITKELGLTLYGLAVSSDRVSPLYRNISGTEELDLMQDDLAAGGFPLRPEAQRASGDSSVPAWPGCEARPR